MAGGYTTAAEGNQVRIVRPGSYDELFSLQLVGKDQETEARIVWKTDKTGKVYYGLLKDGDNFSIQLVNASSVVRANAFVSVDGKDIGGYRLERATDNGPNIVRIDAPSGADKRFCFRMLRHFANNPAASAQHGINIEDPKVGIVEVRIHPEFLQERSLATDSTPAADDLRGGCTVLDGENKQKWKNAEPITVHKEAVCLNLRLATVDDPQVTGKDVEDQTALVGIAPPLPI